MSVPEYLNLSHLNSHIVKCQTFEILVFYNWGFICYLSIKLRLAFLRIAAFYF